MRLFTVVSESNKMFFKNIFVTVGTTEFNELISKLSQPELFTVFKDHLRCEELKIQIGRGERIEFKHFDEAIKVVMFDLKESIAGDIDAADLVNIA